MSKIAPCLWFDDRAEEAANFYVAAFRESGREAAIGDLMRYGDAGPPPKGTVLTVTFTLDGQEFIALNGGPHFTFSPAITLFVTCRHPAQLDAVGGRLSDAGEPGQRGRLTDRYGGSSREGRRGGQGRLDKVNKQG